VLSPAELRERMSYDPETGIFVWLQCGRPQRIGTKVGSLNDKGYLCTQFVTRAGGNRQFKMHRLAWLYMMDSWPEIEVDHINLDKADNRWRNLRSVSRSENMCNRNTFANNTSGQKGVNYHIRRRAWAARIQRGGKRISLGYFEEKDAAIQAYRAAVDKYHGSYANPN